jgi:hypothetical protein
MFRLLLRHRKAHGESTINANAWMMSYADMATTLLAMFIVLSTMGKDQSGISLYNGTGSFLHAEESLGLPGFFPSSSHVISLQEAGPHYQVGEPADAVAGDKGSATKSRVIDGEEENLQRFLREIDRQFAVAKLPRAGARAAVDFYEPLNRKPPYLDSAKAATLKQVLEVLRRPGCRVSLIVWATTPSKSAWERAAAQARLVADDAAKSVGLDDSARMRLLALGQAWRYVDDQRPIMSVIISRDAERP